MAGRHDVTVVARWAGPRREDSCNRAWRPWPHGQLQPLQLRKTRVRISALGKRYHITYLQINHLNTKKKESKERETERGVGGAFATEIVSVYSVSCLRLNIGDTEI